LDPSTIIVLDAANLGRRLKGKDMPMMIGVVGGLMDGLGITLITKGEVILGFAWFLTGVLVAWVLYKRTRYSKIRHI